MDYVQAALIVALTFPSPTKDGSLIVGAQSAELSAMNSKLVALQSAHWWAPYWAWLRGWLR